MASLTPEAQKIFGATYDPPDHLWLDVFFTPSDASRGIPNGLSATSRCSCPKKARERIPIPNRPIDQGDPS
jgi:hypothetical protein